MSVNVELIVKGMRTAHCEQKIEKFLIHLEGVQHVVVTREDGRIELEYNNKDISLKTICDEIEAEGYEVVR